MSYLAGRNKLFVWSATLFSLNKTFSFFSSCFFCLHHLCGTHLAKSAADHTSNICRTLSWVVKVLICTCNHIVKVSESVFHICVCPGGINPANLPPCSVIDLNAMVYRSSFEAKFPFCCHEICEKLALESLNYRELTFYRIRFFNPQFLHFVTNATIGSTCQILK